MEPNQATTPEAPATEERIPSSPRVEGAPNLALVLDDSSENNALEVLQRMDLPGEYKDAEERISRKMMSVPVESETPKKGSSAQNVTSTTTSSSESGHPNNKAARQAEKRDGSGSEEFMMGVVLERSSMRGDTPDTPDDGVGLKQPGLARGSVNDISTTPGAYACMGTLSVDAGLMDVEEDAVSETRDVELAATNESETNGLTVAQMIDASSRSNNNDREVATPVEATDISNKRRQQQTKRIVGGMAVVLLLVVVVVAVALLTADKKAPTQTDSENIAETIAPTPYLVELADYTIAAIQEDANSSQAKAYSWLLLDPYLDNYTNARRQQRMALASIYYATGGDAHWTQNNSWLDYEVPECQWLTKFIPRPYPNGSSNFAEDNNGNHHLLGLPEVCDKKENYVALVLTKNELQGSIPPEIALLTNLFVLDLATNLDLTGTVPSEIGALSNLVEMVVDGCGITGTLPSEIGLLPYLHLLFLHANSLEGTIPTEFTQLSNLEVLSLYRNDLSGTLQSDLARLSNSLSVLTFWGNSLSGAVPVEWAQLSNLKTLDASYNRLINGTIPAELAQISTLEYFYLSANAMSGPVPSELGLLTELKHLWMDGNRLTGTIPHALSVLAKLEILYLAENKLVGTIPTELALIQSLERAWLGPNPLSGTIPSQFGHWPSLYYFGIYDTPQLTGTIPTELAIVRKLRVLSIEGTGLTGTVPTELALLPLLEELWLDRTSLTGTLPLQLGKLMSLERVTVNESSLTGFIPTALCDIVDINPGLLNCSSAFCGCGCSCSVQQTPSLQVVSEGNMTDNSTR